MAEATEIGGVIIPSAIRKAPPAMAGKISHFPQYLRIRAYNDNIPPSPLLSACSVMITYFKVVWKNNVQKIQLKLPKAIASVITLPWKTALRVYRGEVPISPKTIPMAISEPANVIFLWNVAVLCIWMVFRKIEILN
jgi:hypothetical protein